MQYRPNYDRAEEERIQQSFAKSLMSTAARIEAQRQQTKPTLVKPKRAAK